MNENEVVYQRFPGDTLSGDLYSYRPGIYLATFSQTEGTQPNSWNSWNAPPPRCADVTYGARVQGGRTAC